MKSEWMGKEGEGQLTAIDDGEVTNTRATSD
jgi:hypothetical protein